MPSKVNRCLSEFADAIHKAKLGEVGRTEEGRLEEEGRQARAILTSFLGKLTEINRENA